MNFQQLRSVREAVRQGFNLSDVAKVLFTSPPGVSRQILELEDELRVTIFQRHGKRLVGLTEPGKIMLGMIERLLMESDNLRSVGLNYAEQNKGTLVIATTHTQARYKLSGVVSQFREAFPDVRIALQQSAPDQIVESVALGRAHIGIATEMLNQHDHLVSFPCYRWNHILVAPKKHPILREKHITIDHLANYPLITYDQRFTGRGHIDRAFSAAGIQPDIVLTAMDADVIKDYVSLNFGVGIIASMAFQPRRDKLLSAIDASHLFEANTTWIAVKKGSYLRDYTYAFMTHFAPHLTREEIYASINVDES